MKRGRPSERRKIQNEILRILEYTPLPLNTAALTKEISQKMSKQISWNTVYKYLRELVEMNRVEPIKLPHSKEKGKNGLTLYILKK